MSNAGFESREWIPWYVDDVASWMRLTLPGRGLAEGIARKMGRRRSELPLGASGLKALVFLVGRPWAEVEPAIAELLAPGPDGEPPRLVFDAERNVLIDAQAAERQRAVKSTERAKQSKAARAEAEAALANVPNVANVPGGGGNVANVVSPLLSSSEIEDQDPPIRSPMRARDPGWHLDSPLPDNYREDARAKIEPSGADVDISAQWGLYLADRLRPEQVKRIGLQDWRGWILRAIQYAVQDRSKRRAAGHDTDERGSRWGPPKIPPRGGDS